MSKAKPSILESGRRPVGLRGTVMAGAAIAVFSLTLNGQKMPTRYPAFEDLSDRAGLPDPLVTSHGQIVRTRAQWEARRTEIKDIIEHYLTGTMPPPPGNTQATEVDEKALAGGVTYRRVALAFGPDHRLGFEIAIFLPGNATGPASGLPVIVHPSFLPTPGAATQPSPTPTTSPATHPSNDPAEAAEQFQAALARGYAVVTWNYQTCGADRADCRSSGFFPAYPGYDWGDLAAWAWGMSRVVDFLQTQSFADNSRIIALGHSRLGKATLIAGAFDERFALVASAGSGCTGTGVFRMNGRGRGGKEGLEDYVGRFPWHVGPNLAQFAGHVDRLPFDQHWLIAMVAPRPFILADGIDDPYANGHAAVASFKAALPVYELLGAGSRLGLNYRPGKHLLAPEDWQAVLDFADRELMGKNVTRSFNQIPPTDRLH